MRMKKVVAGLLATAMVITGISIAPKQAEAKMVTSVVYEEFLDIAAAKQIIGVQSKTPVFDGIAKESSVGEDLGYMDVAIDATAEYLFGGWYVSYFGEKSEGEWKLIKEAGDIDEYITDSDNDGYDDVHYSALCIKWVPASILSVKAQNTANTKAESASTNTRVISSVDSLDYFEVGFEVLLNNKTSLGELKTTKVYEALKSSNGQIYDPSEIFGAGATHFIVWRLTGIEQINFEKIIYVRPYWVTADGVKVEGLAKYVHVEDEYNGYISVPINLNVLSTAMVAAGVVEISYPAGLELVEDEFETGRVFEEKEFADKGTTVKIAANVQDINNNKQANDIYMNLRFKVTDISKLDANEDNMVHTECNFEIQGTPDFCDNTETKVSIDIWDVLY